MHTQLLERPTHPRAVRLCHPSCLHLRHNGVYIRHTQGGFNNVCRLMFNSPLRKLTMSQAASLHCPWHSTRAQNKPVFLCFNVNRPDSVCKVKHCRLFRFPCIAPLYDVLVSPYISDVYLSSGGSSITLISRMPTEHMKSSWYGLQ